MSRAQVVLVVTGLLLTLVALASAVLTAPAPLRLRSAAGRREDRLCKRLRQYGKVELGSYTLFVKELEGLRLLRHPVLKRKDAGGEIDLVWSAREGSLQIDAEGKRVLLRLKSGDGLGSDGSRAWFEDRVLELPLPADLDGK